jgi:hypothetical protein
LVVDESTSLPTAQVYIFALDVTSDSELLEGLVDLPSMQGQTKGHNSIQALYSLQTHNLELHKRVGIVINVALSVIGSRVV